MLQTTTEQAREAALAFLYGRIDYERSPAESYSAAAYRLERMRELLARLGNPGAGVPIVHVAGTKGKGSTSAMVAGILAAAGYRTGLFTSPHLDRLEERMAVNGHPCAAEELVEYVERVRPAARAMDAAAGPGGPTGPTYFELTTAMALLHFERTRVDVAVLEVGMGGRLDSTNVCRPAVSVITSISFDHMRQLGNTLSAIAREKAGIVKPGVPVVSGVVTEEPRRAIEEVCRGQGCPLVQLGRDFDFQYRPPRDLDRGEGRAELDFRFFVPGREIDYRNVALGLLGRHQAGNAAVALAVVEELRRQGWTIGEAACRRGLADIHWPARVELIRRRPTIVIDAAHNLASVAALVETLNESFSSSRRVLVFGTTKEKDVPGMLRWLLPQFDRVVFTRYTSNPRYVPPEELAAEAAKLGGPRPIVCADAESAWETVRRDLSEEELVCVTGSFFIAAEMRAEIERRPVMLGGREEATQPHRQFTGGREGHE